MEMITTNNITEVAQNMVTVPANHIIVQQIAPQPVQTKFMTTTLNVTQPISNGPQMIHQTGVNSPQIAQQTTTNVVQTKTNVIPTTTNVETGPVSNHYYLLTNVYFINILYLGLSLYEYLIFRYCQ